MNPRFVVLTWFTWFQCFAFNYFYFQVSCRKTSFPWYNKAKTKWPPFCRWHFTMQFFFCENILILLRFHLNLFPRVQLTIRQHWFGLWLGTGQATSHYLSQCYPRSLSPYGGTRPEWVNILKPGQNSKYCADNIVKHIFLKEIVKLWIKS